MPRPRGWTPYTTKDGAEVPSVTTILGKFRDPGALMWWSWNEGKAGRDFRATRDDAASAGTLAHAMVESDIRGRAWVDPFSVDPDVLAKAKRAYENYLEWKAQTQLRAIASEVRLVSERHRFGGTIDALMIGGKLTLGDLKTSSSVYTEHLIQVAAYSILWEEAYPDQPLTGGYCILRIARDTADFAFHHYGELEGAKRMFLLLREAYDLDRALKARVR